MEYGVSRIPVRFAVQKLIGEDWLVPDDRNKDYDTAYFYLKRDHFDHSISGRSVADLVEQRLQTLRAAEKSKKK